MDDAPIRAPRAILSILGLLLLVVSGLATQRILAASQSGPARPRIAPGPLLPRPLTTGVPSPVQTGQPPPVQTGQPSPIPTGIPTPIQTGVPPRIVPPRAHVCIALEEAADLTIAPGVVLTYTIHLSNAGPGTAGGTSVRFPLDPNLTFLNFLAGHTDSYVEYTGTDAVVVRFGQLAAGEAVTGQLTVRVQPATSPGTRIAARATASWDDNRHRTRLSNVVTLAVGATTDRGRHGLQQPLAVAPADPIATGTVLTMHGDFFGEDEGLSFWLNQPDGTVIALPAGRQTDAAGLLDFSYDTTGLPAGAYSLVAHGLCTGMEGVAIFTVK